MDIAGDIARIKFLLDRVIEMVNEVERKVNTIPLARIDPSLPSLRVGHSVGNDPKRLRQLNS